MPCNNCGKKGTFFNLLEQCMDGDCSKKYCSRCATKFLIECEDCESCYCEEHFEEHECEEDEYEDEEDEYEDAVDKVEFYYSLSKKKATIVRDNLSARQEMELIEKLEDEGYVESARDEQVLLFTKIKEEKKDE